MLLLSNQNFTVLGDSKAVIVDEGDKKNKKLPCRQHILKGFQTYLHFLYLLMISSASHCFLEM